MSGPAEASDATTTAETPTAATKRRALFEAAGAPTRHRLLFVVLHCRAGDTAHAASQAAIAAENGADGAFVITHDRVGTGDMGAVVRELYLACRAAAPGLFLGVNLLGLSPSAARAALPAGARAFWSDGGVSGEAGAADSPELAKMAAAREADAASGSTPPLWFGGFSFKGHKEIAVADLPALGRVASAAIDVPTTSGRGTGVALDPRRAPALRAAVGPDVPLALASGVDVDNVGEYLPFIDAFLVGTGVERPLVAGDAASEAFAREYSDGAHGVEDLAAFAVTTQMGVLDAARVRALAGAIHAYMPPATAAGADETAFASAAAVGGAEGGAATACADDAHTASARAAGASAGGAGHAVTPAGTATAGGDGGGAAPTSAPSERVVCIGDQHGNLKELQELWAALTRELGETGLRRAAVVWLGDCCDRGPDTKGVIDFMLRVKAERAATADAGPMRYIAGNHCFGFACYLGCVPWGPAGSGSVDPGPEEPPPMDLESTRNSRFSRGFWPHPAPPHGMHYQGRRWGGAYVYNANTTFASYGCDFDFGPKARDALRAAVPEAHKRFLRDLEWVVDLPVAFAPGRVVAVHAGLDPRAPLAPQLAALASRDLAAPALFEKGDRGRFFAFSGRRNVEAMHPELEGAALLVSGHHGSRSARRGRVICDRSGGTPGPGAPLEAVVFDASGSRFVSAVEVERKAPTWAKTAKA